jgi:hypothetical protein
MKKFLIDVKKIFYINIKIFNIDLIIIFKLFLSFKIIYNNLFIIFKLYFNKFIKNLYKYCYCLIFS